MTIFTKLSYQYMANLFNFSSTSNHLHPLQVENCDSNSRLVVGEDDKCKVRIERVNSYSPSPPGGNSQSRSSKIDLEYYRIPSSVLTLNPLTAGAAYIRVFNFY